MHCAVQEPTLNHLGVPQTGHCDTILKSHIEWHVHGLVFVFLVI